LACVSISKPWDADILALRQAGKSWSETAEVISEKFADQLSDLSGVQMISLCRTVMLRLSGGRRKIAQAKKQRDQQIQKVVKPVPAQPKAPAPMPLMDLLKQGGALPDLAVKMGVSSRVAEAMVQDARDSGYNIEDKDGHYKLSLIAPPKENRVKEAWNGEKIIRFGLLGDSHLNSKYTQITFLHELYDIFKAEGLVTVYHSGDMDEGERMRPGHQYECYTQGADDHIKEIVRVYPKRDGITTKYILGNHDYAFIKHVGLDIGPQISSLRPDLIYLGQSSAIIGLTDGCTLELRHPGDGSAYALSYKIQKMIDAMSGGEKPSILATGHYHKAEYLFYRNIHAFQTGTTCAQTPWMRSKQISAHVGGWVVEAHVHDDGTVSQIKSEFIPCYKCIKDDYKSWLVS